MRRCRVFYFASIPKRNVAFVVIETKQSLRIAGTERSFFLGYLFHGVILKLLYDYYYCDGLQRNLLIGLLIEWN